MRYPDPTKATGDEWPRWREYAPALLALERQMRIFMQLPSGALDLMAMKKRLGEIGAAQEGAQ